MIVVFICTIYTNDIFLKTKSISIVVPVNAAGARTGADRPRPHTYSAGARRSGAGKEGGPKGAIPVTAHRVTMRSRRVLVLRRKETRAQFRPNTSHT